MGAGGPERGVRAAIEMVLSIRLRGLFYAPVWGGEGKGA